MDKESTRMPAVRMLQGTNDFIFKTIYEFDSVSLVRRGSDVVGYMFHLSGVHHHGHISEIDTVLFAKARMNLRLTGAAGRIYADHEDTDSTQVERLVIMDEYEFPRVLERSHEVGSLFDAWLKPRGDDVRLDAVPAPVPPDDTKSQS